MQRDDVLMTPKAAERALRECGVAHAALFGSVARGVVSQTLRTREAAVIGKAQDDLARTLLERVGSLSRKTAIFRAGCFSLAGLW